MTEVTEADLKWAHSVESTAMALIVNTIPLLIVAYIFMHGLAEKPVLSILYVMFYSIVGGYTASLGLVNVGGYSVVAYMLSINKKYRLCSEYRRNNFNCDIM